MKKFFAIITLAALLCGVCLSGCNMSCGLGSFTFNRIHICMHDGTVLCERIVTWYDYTQGIEVVLEDGTHIWATEGAYLLSSGKCPICEK